MPFRRNRQPRRCFRPFTASKRLAAGRDVLTTWGAAGPNLTAEPSTVRRPLAGVQREFREFMDDQHQPSTQPDGEPKKDSPPRPKMSTPLGYFLLVTLLIVGLLIVLNGASQFDTIAYDFFYDQLEDGNIAEIGIQGDELFGKFKKPPADPEGSTTTDDRGEKVPKQLKEQFVTVLAEPYVGTNLEPLLRQHKVKIINKKQADNTGMFFFLSMLVPIALFVFIWIMIRRTRDQFMGGGILGAFNKSPAKRYEETDKPTTFDDVAGLEGVKSDLQEVVEFLKNPEKFQRLGGRIPKGTLLMGPPGTGKTLLAKAVAGEAGVPFYSINGSEFIQMFVGVGASRVRDMFKTAKDNAPCILFIDEIDAVGRVRGAGLGGGHDEREQTLNQILSEMDGFSPNESVIVLAATNRPDVLDPALLRPGRFDRHVTVDRPNVRAREAILKVHTQDVPLSEDIDFTRLAKGTVGLTGADLRNLVNEAALLATRKGKDHVDMDDFDLARDKILMGATREDVLSDKEKRTTAYHEAGHALLAWLQPGADRVHKVTIIPRGRALGVTQLLPEEDRLNIGETELYAQLTFMMGGRAAEKLVFDEYSAGAENDLTRATQTARRMVTHWGMSDRLGPVAYRTSDEHPFLGKEMSEPREFSEHTAQVIDEEVARILHGAADRASKLLQEHRDKLDCLAGALEEREMIDDKDIEKLIGPAAIRLNAQSNGQADVANEGSAVPASSSQTNDDT